MIISLLIFHVLDLTWNLQNPFATSSRHSILFSIFAIVLFHFIYFWKKRRVFKGKHRASISSVDSTMKLLLVFLVAFITLQVNTHYLFSNVFQSDFLQFIIQRNIPWIFISDVTQKCYWFVQNWMKLREIRRNQMKILWMHHFSTISFQDSSELFNKFGNCDFAVYSCNERKEIEFS